MAQLWTPYFEDKALDLTKPVVKLEPLSPVLVSPPTGYHRYTPATSRVPHTMRYFYQPPAYGYPHTVPQVSPSCSSVYEEYNQPLAQQQEEMSPSDSSEDYITPNLTRLTSSLNTELLANDPGYQAFERDALRAMAEKNGGTLLGNNPRMRRSVCVTKETVNECYRVQRERNNFAAKQSRDRRKLREVRLALNVSYLEKEAARLKTMLASRVCVGCHQPAVSSYNCAPR